MRSRNPRMGGGGPRDVTLDQWSWAFAALGSVPGGIVTLALFGLLNPSLGLDPTWGPYIVSAYISPLFPAAGAFALCRCSHPGARGWPFVRTAAAVGAYFGWCALGAFAIASARDLSGPYGAAALPFVLAPFLATPGLTALVGRWAHRGAEAGPPGPNPLLGPFLLRLVPYAMTAVAFGVVATPQFVFLAGSEGGFAVIFLPIPLFLFAMGILVFLRAAMSASSGYARENMLWGALLHALPLILILQFALQILLANVIPGDYTLRDPVYRTTKPDPTLALTPALGFATLALLIVLLLTGTPRINSPNPPLAPGSFPP